MRILVIGLVKAQQLLRLREEAEKRGHTVDGCYSNELLLRVGANGFEAELSFGPLAGYDVYFFWALDRYKHEWFIPIWDQMRRRGAHVVNRQLVEPGTIGYSTPAEEYRVQVEQGLRFPRSVMLADPASVDEACLALGFPMIVKGSQSRQGKGVHLIQDRESLLQLLMEKRHEFPAFILREFIPNDGDLRVFTVGYKAIGAMKRTAAHGEFRSNISQGGVGTPFDLERRPDVREMAEALSRGVGYEVAGVDIMLHRDTGEAYILEINAGPEIAGIERYTGTNVAGEIVLYFERLVQERTRVDRSLMGA